MPQHRVHGGRPRLRGAADFVADAYGSETAAAGQPSFGHPPLYRDLTSAATEIVDAIRPKHSHRSHPGRPVEPGQFCPPTVLINRIRRLGLTTSSLNSSDQLREP